MDLCRALCGSTRGLLPRVDPYNEPRTESTAHSKDQRWIRIVALWLGCYTAVVVDDYARYTHAYSSSLSLFNLLYDRHIPLYAPAHTIVQTACNLLTLHSLRLTTASLCLLHLTLLRSNSSRIAYSTGDHAKCYPCYHSALHPVNVRTGM